MKLNLFLLIFNLFIIISSLFCFNPIGLKNDFIREMEIKRRIQLQTKIDKPKLKWTEEWFDNVPIDHFSSEDSRTFKLRYLINTDYFKYKDAPIFFCLGDEGGIDDSTDYNGFMVETASEFGAALIFAEHRFFYNTLPFGNETYTKATNMVYLSQDQAIADYVLLIKYLKEKRLVNAKKSPVITFGSSYGGELNAWMRLKYPNVTAGAIASSAPINYFINSPTLSQSSYYDVVMRTYLHYAEGRTFLNKNYHLSPLSQINDLNDAQQLIDVFTSTMIYSSRWNFNNFDLTSQFLPAVESCKAFTSAKTFEQFALAPYYTINMVYNWTGEKTTLHLWNFTKTAVVYDFYYAWCWLSCTKEISPYCARGPPYDVFERDCPFNLTDYFENFCMATFSKIGYTKDYFQPNWIIDHYGYDFKTATNLVFINGIYDPWSGGGWKQTTTNVGSVYNYMTDGGHTYDIHPSFPGDTKIIRDIRFKEKMHIAEWIHQAKLNSNTTY
ncbi:hypothetical protein Mgra_00007928 [Meloidogyne graminicola]|uniref:Uncharacterized protein n=1 Tax=Meloidogyne graminicola TaxID=189291 RepID=A0A8S9ZH93_9BILA|nr:hypothetical protein Mgra_00007928 [Meloidogyne graminicola]